MTLRALSGCGYDTTFRFPGKKGVWKLMWAPTVIVNGVYCVMIYSLDVGPELSKNYVSWDRLVEVVQ